MSPRVLARLLAKIPAYELTYLGRHHGPQFRRHFRQLQHSQWWSAERLRADQNERFLRLIRHAFEQVPYYRRTWGALGLTPGDIRSLDDVTRLPLIDKETVREHGEEFRAANAQQFNPRQKKTSGSTGMPLRFVVDHDAHWLGEALHWRWAQWAGIQSGMRRFTIGGPPFVDAAGQVDFTRLFSVDAMGLRMTINSALVSDQRLGEIAGLLRDFRPHAIMAQPSMLMVLAQYLKAHPVGPLRTRAILLGGELAYPFQRDLFREVFGCQSYDLFAQHEFICFASQCQQGTRHLHGELSFAEIVKDGQPCAPGETGELVCTSLRSFSMPLIRYQTGDLGRIEPVNCPCGRQQPALTIEGCRGKDLVVTPRGYFMVMSSVPFLLKDFKPFRQIQFHQETRERLEVRIVRREAYTAEEVAAMERTLAAYFNHSIRVQIVFVDAIPRDGNMKYKYVDSRVPIRF